MAVVRSLGYAVVESERIDAWRSFATGLLGLQIAQDTGERLLLRMDEYAYRLEIRRGAAEAVTVLGWEVGGPAELAELAGRVEAAGHPVTRHDRTHARERRVTELVGFRDPDDQVTLELFYGLEQSVEPFVSPTGAAFVTGTGGMGHAFQLVRDEHAYRRLYLDVLGFKLSDFVDSPSGAELTFLHCNPRHHSYAFGATGAPSRIGHLMLEVDDLDTVGRANDKALAGGAPIHSTFGRHTNDKMYSVYLKTPSGFAIEYGHGGIEIDDETWTPTRYPKAHYWGHNRAQAS